MEMKKQRAWVEEEMGQIPLRERFGLDKLKHRHCNWQRREQGESEWEEKDEEDQEEEYQAPVKDRLQHAGFDHMTPPSAGNTKTCDYPKHTGSDWVPEPALFPTRPLRPAWDVWFCWAVLSGQHESRKIPLLCTSSQGLTTLVITQRQ